MTLLTVLRQTADRKSFLAERVGKPFPLLKCLRKHYGRHCEPFSSQKCTVAGRYIQAGPKK